MRWLWIDRIVSLEPGRRLVAVKNVSLAEEHLHDHFAASGAIGPGVDPDKVDPEGVEPSVMDWGGLAQPALPVMPGSLVIEGMAQAAGILVGHAEGFAEKVILAKIARVELDRDAVPGTTIRYTATLDNLSASGASASGVIELLDHARGAEFGPMGRAQLLFSHLDRNMAGDQYPEHNFVFGQGFRDLLRNSGIAVE